MQSISALLRPVALLVAAAWSGVGICQTTSDPLADPVQVVCDGITCGPQPGTDELSYDSLAARGIRSVVCVDTLPPDVDAARAAGLVVVHIPTRYSGIEDAALAGLRLAAERLPKPIYVHCHHGRHRGPAAAAVMGRILGELDQQSAVDVLTVAHTDPHYVGLWNSVRDLSPQDLLRVKQANPNVTLVPRVEPPPRAVVMKSIDRDFERLKAAEAADDQQQVALIAEQIAESFREWQRYETQVDSKQIESAYRAAKAVAKMGSGDLGRSCTECHQKFR